MRAPAVAVVLAAAGRVAAAAPADAYPAALVDRPLILPDGVAEADLTIDSAASHDLEQGIFDVVTGTVAATRSFGGVAPFAGATVTLHQPTDADRLAAFDGGVDVALGEHARAEAQAGLLAPMADGGNGYLLAADVAAKLRVVPGAVALVGDAGAVHTKQHIQGLPGFVGNDSDLTIAHAGAGAQAQVPGIDRLALTGGLDVVVPLAHSPDLTPSTHVDAAAGARYAFGRVDAIASARVIDVAGVRDLELLAGAAARF